MKLLKKPSQTFQSFNFFVSVIAIFQNNFVRYQPSKHLAWAAEKHCSVKLFLRSVVNIGFSVGNEKVISTLLILFDWIRLI